MTGRTGIRASRGQLFFVSQLLSCSSEGLWKTMEKDTRNKVDPEMAGVRLASQELCDNTEPWAGAQAPANKGKESPKQDWSNIIK